MWPSVYSGLSTDVLVPTKAVQALLLLTEMVISLLEVQILGGEEWT